MQQEERIEAFRKRLLADPRLLAEFLEAPLGVMGREGVQVSPHQAAQLRDVIAATAAHDTAQD